MTLVSDYNTELQNLFNFEFTIILTYIDRMYFKYWQLIINYKVLLGYIPN